MRKMDTVSPSPLDARFFGWKRWVIGTLVIQGLMILQLVRSFLNRDRNAPLALAFLVVTVPVLTFTASLCHRWVTRRRLGSGLALFINLVMNAAVGAACTVIITALIRNVPSLSTLSDGTRSYPIAAAIGGGYGLFMCAYWALAFVYPFAAEDARLRALETEKLKLEAEQLRAAAELAHLRAQLEPHFLLNTLNTIAGLVTQDPREARRLLACLGDLLRDALRDADEMQTLDDEIAWLRRYAEILESRHAGSLSFQWEIEKAAENVSLPRLLLQPLVENAVKHGALRRRGGGGTVLVRAVVSPAESASTTRLICTIEDNGPGVPNTPPRSGAIGLRAVRRRLELKYADASMRLESSPDGSRAIVELPCIPMKKQSPSNTYVEA
jgi:signal transduction histidine kinase